MDAYVVEPQSLFVPFLSDVLAGAQMRVVRFATTLDIEDIRSTGPQALFIDTDFLEMDAADAVRATRAALPLALICAYSDEEAAPAEHLRFAGANCVLSKRLNPRQFKESLRSAQREITRPGSHLETVSGEFNTGGDVLRGRGA